MFSISETYFAELHTLNASRLTDLHESYKSCFPHSMDVFVSHTDYARMILDIESIAGEGHPETSTTYSTDTYLWSEFHPRNSHMYRNGQLVLATKIGFKNSRHALQFKLKWFQS